jgi:hypothetical protein
MVLLHYSLTDNCDGFYVAPGDTKMWLSPSDTATKRGASTAIMTETALGFHNGIFDWFGRNLSGGRDMTDWTMSLNADNVLIAHLL